MMITFYSHIYINGKPVKGFSEVILRQQAAGAQVRGGGHNLP